MVAGPAVRGVRTAARPDREDRAVLVSVSWKTRPMDSATLNRMMASWGTFESLLGAHADVRRRAWWSYADASGGFSVLESDDGDALSAFVLEASVALGEFLEIDCRPVLALDAAQPAIVAGLTHKSA
jgi:hypothetical protein